jgi:hypothetical protein
VRIRIQDLNDPHIPCDILVHDVLCVPGLSRRLLSADQWNAAGGKIWFHPNHTTLRAVDSDTGEAQSFSVAKPFTLLRNFDGLPSATSQTESTRPPRNTQQEAHASVRRAAAVTKKNTICSDLLHRCLGHRTVNTIMSGSRNEVWADTAMRWEGDDFSNSCRIVTGRLANRGKSPLNVKHGNRRTHYVPRHQAQNGICERAWQSIRKIAFKMMLHAHMPDAFYDFALEHARKVFNCLLIRDLELNGKPCTPIESCTGNKPHLARFRVLFCPCVLGIGQANQGRGPIIRRNNCPERGLRGIHVGTPRHQDGWPCCLPTTGGLKVSANISFDENFFSAAAHAPSKSTTRFPGSQNSMQTSSPMMPIDGNLEHAGDAWPFTSAIGGLTDPSAPALTLFAQLGVDELHDEDDRDVPPLLSRDPIGTPAQACRILSRLVGLT